MANTQPQLKGWDHASRLFRDNNYELAPKTSFLYHVFFELNAAATISADVIDSSHQTEIGMLVKQLSLPKFTIDTKSLNAYNRNHIVQYRIHYDPVSITFHDDSADRVRDFWFDYYTYYFRTSDYGDHDDFSTLSASRSEIVSGRKQKDWGYTMRGSTDGTLVKEPYLSAVRIYSLHNKKFSEYILVNPIIKSFQHGEHNSTSNNDTLTHTMMIEYESILYASDTIEATQVQGFGDIHYDNTVSPLPASGPESTGLKSGVSEISGIFGSTSSILSTLTSGNFGSALLQGASLISGLNGDNFGAMLQTNAEAIAKGVISQAINPFGSVNIPVIGSLTAGIGVVSEGIKTSLNTLTGLATASVDSLTGTLSRIQTENTIANAYADTASRGQDVEFPSNLTEQNISAAYADPSRSQDVEIPVSYMTDDGGGDSGDEFI